MADRPSHSPPQHCWTRQLACADPSPRVHRNSTPPLLEILQLLPVAYRVGRYINAERYNQREPIFDLEGIDLHPPNPGPGAGVPCGGIGGGSIGRGFRGDFRRWSLFPGRYVHSVVHANQFAVRTNRKQQGDGESTPLQDKPHAQILSVSDGSASGAMQDWDWNFPQDNVTYHALYPRAWTVYEMPEDKLTLTCKQVSPVIPHDYVNSSVPACVFEWTIENHDSTDAEVSLMFTWDNNPALASHRRGNHRHEIFAQRAQAKDDKLAQTDVKGVVMHSFYDSLKHTSNADSQQSYCGQRAPEVVTHPMSMCVAAVAGDGVTVTVCEAFNLSAAERDEADELWRQFKQAGDITNVQTLPHAREDAAAAAVCARVAVPANQSSTVKFVLSWDVSLACFGEGLHIPRFHTRWFGVGGGNAGTIASYAAHMCSSWDSDIVDWQDPILSDSELPDYYKALLFNELYFVSDGGTVWTDSVDGEHCAERAKSHQFQQLVTRSEDGQVIVIDANAASEFNHVAQNCEGDQRVIGQFLYLEGHEYLMYNTYDVHFYASFALLQLWPMLELSIQRDFARAVAVEDLDTRTMLGDGHVRPRKLAGRIAHDLGSPCEHPWKKPNIYNFQDVSQWKDLGPKFILQVYRDHKFVVKNTSNATKPSNFLAALYDTCRQVMESCTEFDRDGDGMIENDGVPDQTYDIWSVTGVSAYCGGLWCAACSAMASMAYCMDDSATAAKYEDLALKSREVYDKQLWNGRYFNYDNNGGYSHDSIMADQLAGQWYCRVCDLPPVTDPTKALSTYRTIFQYNVEMFGNGQLLGAVNGMRPNGEIDMTALQSREVWTGTTYAVAAAMLLEAKALTTNEDVPAFPDDDQNALLRMAFSTAQGIHDAGWKEFGYWFATPEGWERSGNYRSLGYMRPLAIWAIHFAWEKCYKSAPTSNRGIVL